MTVTAIESIASKLHWDVLSPSEIERIEEATVHVLEQTGVRFPSAAAQDVLEGGGCRVDRASGVVRMPRRVVEHALEQAPRRYVLASGDAAMDVSLGAGRCYLSNDASGVSVLDHRTQLARPSTKADVAQSARFIDALPQIGFCWGPIVTSLDRPPETRALHDAEAVFLHTRKHFQTVTTVGERPARYLVEMAAAVAGGLAQLRTRPLISFMQCTVDPLGHDGLNLEANLVAAQHGLPCGFMPMPLAGGTGPATLAGTLVVHNAGTLSGLVLLQLAQPGTPVFFSGAPSVIDLRSGAYTGGSPEDHLMAAAAVQLARHHGLPIAMGTMGTGAKEPGWQAAVDDAFSTFASVMSGADMMNGTGLLNGSRILSYPHILLELEIFTIAKRLAAGIDVDDDSLALEIIDSVGPGGSYLARNHTRRHCRDIWQSRLWDRTPYDAWVRSGRQGALESATVMADDLLSARDMPVLPEDLEAELRSIVAHADAELVGR